MRIVDFRSDTVTKPSPEMRQAMATAEVGDDGWGDDPTVNRLEEMAAKRLGKEASVFVASGTMGNLASIMAQCPPGDEMILGDRTHIFLSDTGNAPALGGVKFHPLHNDVGGMLDPDEVRAAIRSDTAHGPRTSLIALENTHNVCGGRVLTPQYTTAIAGIAREHDLPLHLDGARIFNAAVYLETPVAELAAEADTVSFCLSKGLACPVGSLVCGSQETIEKVRLWRKQLGGTMRQVGIVAAAGILALETMVERLAEDHANARRLAGGLRRIPGISIDPDSYPTNLVFIEVTLDDPEQVARDLEQRGILGYMPSRRWRFVTHFGITGNDIDYALDVIDSVFRKHAAA